MAKRRNEPIDGIKSVVLLPAKIGLGAVTVVSGAACQTMVTVADGIEVLAVVPAVICTESHKLYKKL